MADWMPPLPEPAAYRWQSTVGGWAYGQRRDINPHAFADEYAIEKLYTADQMRQAQAEAAARAVIGSSHLTVYQLRRDDIL